MVEPERVTFMTQELAKKRIHTAITLSVILFIVFAISTLLLLFTGIAAPDPLFRPLTIVILTSLGLFLLTSFYLAFATYRYSKTFNNATYNHHRKLFIALTVFSIYYLIKYFII